MPRGQLSKNTPTASPAKPAAPRRRANIKPQVPFAFKPILNQWLLSLFHVKRFEDLAKQLSNGALEELDILSPEVIIQ